MAQRGGARPGSGNPGHVKIDLIRDEVKRLTPKWFALTEKWIDGKDKRLKSLAYQELGKLMSKSMPVDLSTENGPIEFVIKHYGNHPANTTSGDTPQVSA